MNETTSTAANNNNGSDNKIFDEKDTLNKKGLNINAPSFSITHSVTKVSDSNNQTSLNEKESFFHSNNGGDSIEESQGPKVYTFVTSPKSAKSFSDEIIAENGFNATSVYAIHRSDSEYSNVSSISPGLSRGIQSSLDTFPSMNWSHESFPFAQSPYNRDTDSNVFSPKDFLSVHEDHMWANTNQNVEQRNETTSRLPEQMFPPFLPSTAGFTAVSSKNTIINRRDMEPIDGFIYQVQFKRAHKNYILSPSAPRNIIPGDFVKVEADRGEDMGIVLSKIPACEFEEVIPTAGYRGRGFSSGQGERKFLFRLATVEERAELTIKVEDEDTALEVIRSKVIEKGLCMSILDAEYQFDRHKLTFFFEADRRVDFRELVSELFSLYKTRIWMQQVDTSTLNIHDAGIELAKATGFLSQNDNSYKKHHSNNNNYGTNYNISDVNTQEQYGMQVVPPSSVITEKSNNNGHYMSPFVNSNCAFRMG